MEFRLLGPFEARHDGQHIEVGTRRQERCLLGILLLDADRMVPVTRLIDLLWNGDAPESARGAVHTYIGRLRNSLQQYGLRILTLGEGYLAEVAPHTVDTTEFTRVAQQAAAVAEPAERIRLLDQALDLWRGPLLSDVADDRLRGRLGTGLLELRLSSSELRAAAHLATGQHDRVVTDLIPLAAEHPTRERLIAHLMTGLYRCGRQAEALELYRDTRQTLVSELGIEPGPELGELHQRILRNEPDLLRKTPAPV
ncbi:MAG: AfsR/SARP family transcriptional regulator, partial [Micromonosporaceae bacterium]